MNDRRYEEGTHGELVMQQPVWKGYSGLGQDTVSPLDYAPKLDFTRPNNTKGLNFAKVVLPIRRVNFRIHDNSGNNTRLQGPKAGVMLHKSIPSGQ